MKSLKNFLSYFFVFICSVLLSMGLLLITPFDYIKYKCSPYYKKYKKRYRFCVGIGYNFKLCNEILENDLPIRLVENPMDDSVECLYFVFGKTLIIMNVLDFKYNSAENEWQCYSDECENSEVFTLQKYIALEIDGINQTLNNTVCDDAIVLISKKCVDNVELAKKEKCFLLYDNDRVEVLKKFCGIE